MYQVKEQHLHADLLLDLLFNFSTSVNGMVGFRLIVMKLNMYFILNKNILFVLDPFESFIANDCSTGVQYH